MQMNDMAKCIKIHFVHFHTPASSFWRIHTKSRDNGDTAQELSTESPGSGPGCPGWGDMKGRQLLPACDYLGGLAAGCLHDMHTGRQGGQVYRGLAANQLHGSLNHTVHAVDLRCGSRGVCDIQRGATNRDGGSLVGIGDGRADACRVV